MVSASVHSLRGFLSTLAVRLHHLSCYLWFQHRRTAASRNTQTRLGACSQTVWPAQSGARSVRAVRCGQGLHHIERWSSSARIASPRQASQEVGDHRSMTLNGRMLPSLRCRRNEARESALLCQTARRAAKPQDAAHSPLLFVLTSTTQSPVRIPFPPTISFFALLHPTLTTTRVALATAPTLSKRARHLVLAQIRPRAWYIRDVPLFSSSTLQPLGAHHS